jgi:hypothetical protein
LPIPRGVVKERSQVEPKLNFVENVFESIFFGVAHKNISLQFKILSLLLLVKGGSQRACDSGAAL